jgi:hypothetical protein
MKSTLSDNKQLFNVKAIAVAGKTPDQLVEGEMGIFPLTGGTSIADTTAFAALPSEVMLISRVGGKIYISIDPIKKSTIANQLAKTYTAPVVNIWETVVDNCECITSLRLNLNLNEQSLIQRDGLTWTHNDFVVEVAPEELKCLCDLTKKPEYHNNVMTQLLDASVNAINSPFYESEVKIDVTGVTVYADQAALDIAIPSPTAGAVAVVTADLATKVYDGSAWIIAGDLTGLIADVPAYVEALKAVNTNESGTTFGPKLTFVIKGKVQAAGLYRDLEVNYIYPRGVALSPAMTVNSNSGNAFTETQAMVFEIGAGYDLRAEEFECMSLYTNLNNYNRLCDGIAAPELVYQFENNTNYDTLTFEFDTLKVERSGSADTKRFSMLLGSEVGSGVHAKLVTMFIP